MIEEIAAKLDLLKDYVNILRSYQKHKINELKENFTLRGAIERYFEISLECALDIGEMIISAENFEKTDSYREIIEVLGNHNVLPKEFSEKFAPAASFRNILVHAYARLDIEKLYELLQENLDDFDEFSRYIAEYLINKGETL